MNQGRKEKGVHVGVIGAGSWGTALAQVVALNGAKVLLVTRTEEQAEFINVNGTNPKYLKGVTLSPRIKASHEWSELRKMDRVVLAVPTSVMRETTEKLQLFLGSFKVVLISVSKGIERRTGSRMSQVIREVLPSHPVAVLSGPNHAEEISLGLPACSVIGCEDDEVAKSLQVLFSSSSFRTYTSQDVTGIEWGGAMKNVFAIAAGMVRGLELGDNAIAALVTRGLAEMCRVGVQFGADEGTFMGLSGVGDLMTTCYSTH